MHATADKYMCLTAAALKRLGSSPVAVRQLQQQPQVLHKRALQVSQRAAL